MKNRKMNAVEAANYLTTKAVAELLVPEATAPVFEATCRDKLEDGADPQSAIAAARYKARAAYVCTAPCAKGLTANALELLDKHDAETCQTIVGMLQGVKAGRIARAVDEDQAEIAQAARRGHGRISARDAFQARMEAAGLRKVNAALGDGGDQQKPRSEMTDFEKRMHDAFGPKKK